MARQNHRIDLKQVSMPGQYASADLEATEGVRFRNETWSPSLVQKSVSYAQAGSLQRLDSTASKSSDSSQTDGQRTADHRFVAREVGYAQHRAVPSLQHAYFMATDLKVQPHLLGTTESAAGEPSHDQHGLTKQWTLDGDVAGQKKDHLVTSEDLPTSAVEPRKRRTLRIVVDHSAVSSKQDDSLDHCSANENLNGQSKDWQSANNGSRDMDISASPASPTGSASPPGRIISPSRRVGYSADAEDDDGPPTLSLRERVLKALLCFCDRALETEFEAMWCKPSALWLPLLVWHAMSMSVFLFARWVSVLLRSVCPCVKALLCFNVTVFLLGHWMQAFEAPFVSKICCEYRIDSSGLWSIRLLPHLTL